jgi:hypothetical protein
MAALACILAVFGSLVAAASGHDCSPDLYDSVTASCTGDCTLLFPPRINDPITDECVDVCSDYDYNDNGTCVDGCSSARPYQNRNGTTGTCVADCNDLSLPRLNSRAGSGYCADTCIDNLYNDSGTCAAGCPGIRPYLNLTASRTGTCVADCSTLSPPRLNFPTFFVCVDVWCSAYCVDECGDYYYNDGGTCVRSCSDNPARPYTNLTSSRTGTCVSDCTTLSPPRLNQAYYCKDTCSDSFFNDNGTCVSDCPSARPYQNRNGTTGTCVADCNDLSPPRLNAQHGRYYYFYCVDACDDYYYNNGSACVSTCSEGTHRYRNSTTTITGTCVADCTTLNPPRLNYRFNGGGGFCVDACEAIFNDLGTCVSKCPAARPYINHTSGEDAGTCVDDCRTPTPARLNLSDGSHPTCVSSCPIASGYYLEESGDCSYWCQTSNRYADDASGKCVMDCRDLDPPRLIGPYNKCLDKCLPGVVPNIDNGQCVVSCPAERPHVNGTEVNRPTCVADCGLLNPARRNHPYGTCVDECSDSHYDIEIRACVYTCPSQRPYINSLTTSASGFGICVESCDGFHPPRVLSWSGAFGYCVPTQVSPCACPNERPYVNFTEGAACGNCVANCSALSPPRVMALSSTTWYCVDACEPDQYEDLGVCVHSCPAARAFVNMTRNGHYGTCVADCGLLNPARRNHPYGTCVDECSDSHYDIEIRACVYTCPSQRPYINSLTTSASGFGICVESCDGFHPPRVLSWSGAFGYCVPTQVSPCACPNERPYVNFTEGAACGNCVASCSALSPPRVVALSSTTWYCVDACDPDQFEDLGVCVQSCPAARAFVNMTRNGHYGTCVADCGLLNPPRINSESGNTYFTCADNCSANYDVESNSCQHYCPSQRPYVNATVGSSYGTCVADCRQLNPPRINPPSRAYSYVSLRCIDECRTASAHHDIESNACVETCPGQRPYVNSPESSFYGTCVANCSVLSPPRLVSSSGLFCVDTCTTNEYERSGVCQRDCYPRFEDMGVCVNSCPDERPFVNWAGYGHSRVCVADCRLLIPAKVNSYFRKDTEDNVLACIDYRGCAGYYDIVNGTCETKCPDSRRYVNRTTVAQGITLLTCVADCRLLSPAGIKFESSSPWEDTYQCVDRCDLVGQHYDMESGACVNECPTHRPYINSPNTTAFGTCVASCSAIFPSRLLFSDGLHCVAACYSSQYEDLGVCVSHCPSERPYFTLDTRNCTASCETLDPPKLLSGSVCVDSCPTNYYAMAGNCSYECEGSNWYADQVSGACVADCRDLVPPRLNTHTAGAHCRDVCASGIELNGECVTTCPPGYSLDIGVNRCVNDCGDHCAICASATTCSSCDASVGIRYYAQGGVCSETCASGTLKLIRDHVGSCVVDCPDGTYQVGQDRCESCHASCHTCTDLTATSCTSCNAKTRHLTPDGRCELHLAPGGTCDSAKYPSSQDCAYTCLDGVCCAAPVPWCTECAIGTGKCSACEAGKPLRKGLCGTLIGEDAFNFTALPTTDPPSTLWVAGPDDDDHGRGPDVTSGAVLRCVWGSVAWVVIHSLVTTL